MKRTFRLLPAFVLALTLVLLLGMLPATVHAAGVDAPTVTASNVADSGLVKLTWNAVDDAVKYEVYRATSKTETYSRRTTTTKTYFTNTNAVAGKTYYYYVRAYAADGTYANSKIVSRTCDLPRPVVTAGNSASSGCPTLKWEPIEGAVSYQIYRATSKNGTYTRTKTTTSTSYTNTTAKVGQLYYYKVKAIAENTAANSAYSSLKSRTCDLPRPVVTAGNNAVSGCPTLKWEPIEGAVSYRIYRSDSKDGTYTLMHTTSSTAYTNIDSEAGNLYYYKVMAVAENSAANSAYSSVKSRTCDLAQPQVTISLNSSNKPRLTWDAIEGATGYKIYRSTSKTGTYSLTYTASGTTYTNTKAVDGNTYYYKVRAVCDNSSAASAYSDIVSIRAGNTSDLRYVNQASVYLYKSTSSSSSSVKLYYMTEVRLGEVAKSSSSGIWYEVYYQDNLYYIWITPDSDKLTDTKTTLEYKANNIYQQEVRDLALTIYQEWDCEYVSGESGVFHDDGSVGFDCSGFTCYVINTVMQRHVPVYRLLPETGSLMETYDIYNKGLKGEFRAIDVELEDAQVGDILLFKSATTGQLNHCGMYMGNNEFLHCTSVWDQAVGLMTLKGKYGDLLIGVKRFIPETVESADTTYYATQGNSLYADRKCTERTGISLTKGQAVTVLFTTHKANGDPYVAYIRTGDGTYGFVWLRYFSATK